MSLAGRARQERVSLRPTVAVALLLALAACEGPPPPREAPAGTVPTQSAASAPPAPSASAAVATSATAPPATKGFSKEDFAALLRLSEPPGSFPSDNYVSNETSYLDVARELSTAPKGGAYLGVGPEQSFASLARLQPELALLVDIRRGNQVLHFVYKTLFESASSRAELLARLTSRDVSGAPGDQATLAEVLRWHSAAKRVPAQEAELATAVLSTMRGFGLSPAAEDEKELTQAIHAFAEQGSTIHYTMQGSGRRYPTLAEMAALTDGSGKAWSFFADESVFRAVQTMHRENRIVPLVGDLAGDGAMPRIAEELRRRKLPLNVLYPSNVEQYLFTPKATWNRWLRNVEAMPRTERSLVVRVYFDQGKPHPAQKKGQRTTSLVKPIDVFLARAKSRPYASWFEVATD
jgi:hypothetical protein